MKISTSVPLLFVVMLTQILTGCFQTRTQTARRAQNFSYDHANHSEAANQVTHALRKNKSDVGLLMDLCAYYHYAGNYQRSNEACQRAATQADSLYTLSISEQIGARISSDNVISFQGDEYERLFLHVIAMLNYAAMGQVESALVESRRLDNKVSYFKNHPGPVPSRYKDDAMARYISGLLYEENGDPNDAFIDFRKSIRSFETSPHLNIPAALAQDAMRTARRHGMLEEYQAIKRQFRIQDKPQPLTKDHGEVIIVFENGFAPYKIEKELLPFHLERSSTVNIARVKSLNSGEVTQSQHVRNIGIQAHIRHEERLPSLKKKALANKTLKDALSIGVGTLAFIFSAGQAGLVAASATSAVLSSLQAADLRGWHTLPAQIEIARLKLKPGKHNLAVKLYGHYGTELYRGVLRDVEIRAGKRTWVIQKLP